MGLDAVELVLEVEQTFDITIPMDRASEMLTVGNLYNFLIETTANTPRQNDICLSAATFYALRRSVQTHTQPAAKIHPKDDVHATLPVNQRRNIWRAISKDLDLKLPHLRRPTWLVLLYCLITAVACISTYQSILDSVSSATAIAAAFLVMILFLLTSWFLTIPIAVFAGPTFTTFRGLTTNMLAMNYVTLSDRYDSWNPSDIWDALRLVIVEQLGVKPEDVTPEANFVYDLGAD